MEHSSFTKDGKIIKKDLMILIGRKQGHSEGHMMPWLFTMTCVFAAFDQSNDYRCAVAFEGA